MRDLVLVCVALWPITLAGARLSVSDAPCGKEAWNRFVPDLVAAQSAFARGDPGSMKALWSHTGDVTLMGAWGGHERGWALVGARLDWVSKSNASGKARTGTTRSRRLLEAIWRSSSRSNTSLFHISPEVRRHRSA